MWQHNYTPLGGSLALSALVAAVPIIVLFVMLGVLRKASWMSALTGVPASMTELPIWRLKSVSGVRSRTSIWSRDMDWIT